VQRPALLTRHPSMINHRALVHQYLRKRVHESGDDSDRIRLRLFEFVYTQLKRIEERKVYPRKMFPLFDISTPTFEPEKFFFCIAMADNRPQFSENVDYSGRAEFFKEMWLLEARARLIQFMNENLNFDGYLIVILGDYINPPKIVCHAYGDAKLVPADTTDPVIPSTWQEVKQEFEKHPSKNLLSVQCQIIWKFETISAVLYIQRAWRRWLDRKAWRRRNAICLRELRALPPGTFPTLTEWSVDVQTAKAHFESQQ